MEEQYWETTLAPSMVLKLEIASLIDRPQGLICGGHESTQMPFEAYPSIREIFLLCTIGNQASLVVQIEQNFVADVIAPSLQIHCTRGQRISGVMEVLVRTN